MVVQKGFIVAYRRLITAGDNKPREEATPIHVADVARMTADLQTSPPTDDSVSRALSTPAGTPTALQPSISFHPDRRQEAHSVPPQSSSVPGWNSLGRLATDTPVDKRRRLSQGLDLKSNLSSEFNTPPRRGRKKSKSINLLFFLCLHLLPAEL